MKRPAASDEQISESPVTENLPSHESAEPQTAPEISSGLLELAARVKALEAFHQPSALEPESEEFRAAVFSDVLANAVTQRVTELASQDQVATAENSTLGNFPAQTSMTISRFPSPVNALVNRVEPTLSVTLDETDWAEEGADTQSLHLRGCRGLCQPADGMCCRFPEKPAPFWPDSA